VRTPRGLPTASRLQLALACSGSQALGQVDTAWAAGEVGNEKHRALDAIVSGGDPGEVSEATKDWLMGLDTADLAQLLGLQPEVTLAWDHVRDAGRVLGQRLERAYSMAGPAEYVGTADYLRVAGGCVTVVDLKTGQGDVPAPSRNAQLRMLALAACRAHGVSAARIGILHAPEGRTAWWQWADVDAFELEVIAADLRSLAQRIDYARRDASKGMTPWLRVGEHCTYCPARHECPARTAMARALTSDTVGEDWKRGLDDDATAARCLARWQAARKVVDEVGKALHARAKERAIVLDDGQAWGPVESTREVIDAAKAWPVLDSLLGPEGVKAALTVETSKAGIERGVRVARAAGRLTGSLRDGVTQCLAAVREAGAVETKVRVEYEAHATKP
jgi:hypothetical protein